MKSANSRAYDEMVPLMKMYSAHGFNEFVLCLGYKGYFIKEFVTAQVW